MRAHLSIFVLFGKTYSQNLRGDPHKATYGSCKAFFKAVKNSVRKEQFKLLKLIPSQCSPCGSRDLFKAMEDALHDDNDSLAMMYLDLGVSPEPSTLSLASWRGHVKFVNRIITDYSCVFDKLDREPLHNASTNKNDVVSALLIRNGFLPDMETLYTCSYNGMEKCVNEIMDGGRLTPDLVALHYALDMGNSAIAMTLMDHGAKPDQECLHLAAYKGAVTVVHRLVNSFHLVPDSEAVRNAKLDMDLGEGKLIVLRDGVPDDDTPTLKEIELFLTMLYMEAERKGNLKLSEGGRQHLDNSIRAHAPLVKQVIDTAVRTTD